MARRNHYLVQENFELSQRLNYLSMKLNPPMLGKSEKMQQQCCDYNNENGLWSSHNTNTTCASSDIDDAYTEVYNTTTNAVMQLTEDESDEDIYDE